MQPAARMNGRIGRREGGRRLTAAERAEGDGEMGRQAMAMAMMR